MRIVVASGNIFRRELSVFVLSEAGHHVIEVSDAAALLEIAAVTERQILIVDVLLARGDPAGLRRQIDERGRLPVLWMSHGADPPDLPSLPADGWVSWPYNPDDLLRHVDLLATAAAPDILLTPLRQHYAGDHS